MSSEPHVKSPIPEVDKSNGAEREHNLIKDVFTTGAGKELLDIWVDKYLMRACWLPNCPPGYAEFRAGENHKVLEINMILEQEKFGLNYD